MTDAWVEQQWQDLCRRLRRCSEHWGSVCSQHAGRFDREADEFATQEAPIRYPELIERVRVAADLAMAWQRASRPQDPLPNQMLESEVDEVIDESFPASDPPCWTTAAL